MPLMKLERPASGLDEGGGGGMVAWPPRMVVLCCCMAAVASWRAMSGFVFRIWSMFGMGAFRVIWLVRWTM